MNISSSLCLINPSLRYYIQHFILPFYNKNDAGHQINHIKYVLSRSFQFAPQFPHINPDMLYTCVTFHDIAHHINKDRHAVLSAQAFLADKIVTSFFSDQQAETISQAIADHRSTSSHPPRNHYGKILASADLNTSVKNALRRTHSYTVQHSPNLSLDQKIERGYQHLSKKFGTHGYAINYCIDPDYDCFKHDMNRLLKDRQHFRESYLQANSLDS